ncbi:hypothetical protein LCGC14_2758470 [marine sediment metagenome]|uniref:Uncharacterized protein n=1 Tax=marine sediment metagenome TaxID=412755 RepID=A0A0F8ZLN7_9ZZZZ
MHYIAVILGALGGFLLGYEVCSWKWKARVARLKVEHENVAADMSRLRRELEDLERGEVWHKIRS